jgi:hypothetical protein
MKNKIKILVVILAAILTSIAIFIACNKEETIDTIVSSNSNNSTSTEKGKITINIGDYSITVEGKLYRKIAVRPRDGEICNCGACFGLCDVNITVDGALSSKTTGIFDFDMENHYAELYVIKDLENAESEFGVDEPYFIPKSELPAKMVTEYSINYGITILPSVSEYTFEQETNLVYQGDTIPCYGKVKLNISVR